MTFDFFKYQALGNDYIVIEPESKWFSPNEAEIKEICDRHYGVGSDGILFGPVWENDIPFLRIFNPDGSEAEKSGNGLRIFAHHLFVQGHIKSKQFSIKTISGLVGVNIQNDEATTITIDMGKASFSPKNIPITTNEEWIDKKLVTEKGNYNFTCLSVGNPHAVFFPDNWDEQLINKIGPIIENHKLFPNRTNVQMVRVLDDENIEIRIWERGAGYTQASGSSSCAAAYAAYHLNKTSNKIKVKMPGGIISTFIDENQNIHMTGKVLPVFNGVYSKKNTH